MRPIKLTPENAEEIGERVNGEYHRCLDRAALLVSVAKALATDHLNAAKRGRSGPRFDIEGAYRGIEFELANARKYQEVLTECNAALRERWQMGLENSISD